MKHIGYFCFLKSQRTICYYSSRYYKKVYFEDRL